MMQTHMMAEYDGSDKVPEKEEETEIICATILISLGPDELLHQPVYQVY